ncbi:SDR family oxidoreductase [Streptomyces mayteni]
MRELSHDPDPHDPAEVLVVTGAGGMGMAVARRLGSGRTLLLADASPDRLALAVEALAAEGYTVRGVPTDVGDRASVESLAGAAADEGPVTAVVHTAGVSPATGPATDPAELVLRVNLLGTALVIDAFAGVARRGTSLVCVSSMAGHYAALDADTERALATAPTDTLLDIPAVRAVGADDAAAAYVLSKRANQLRVQAAALPWNLLGARINTISPGVVSTPMARAEAESAAGEAMTRMLKECGADRAGTPAEIAEAAAFLTGQGAGYVTGTDLLVDGGQTGWLRWHRRG